VLNSTAVGSGVGPVGNTTNQKESLKLDAVSVSSSAAPTSIQHASLLGIPPQHELSTTPKTHSVATSNATPLKDAFTTNLAQLIPQAIVRNRDRDDEDAASFRKSLVANAAGGGGDGSYPSRHDSLAASDEVDDDVVFEFGNDQVNELSVIPAVTSASGDHHHDEITDTRIENDPDDLGGIKRDLDPPNATVSSEEKKLNGLTLVFTKSHISSDISVQPGCKSSLSALLKNSTAQDNPFSDYSFFV
jgi:hypothetical protein